MNTNHIFTQRKWFWAWQDDKEEAWLNEMSLKGFHLASPQGATYHFEQHEPKNYVYRLDFRDWNTNQQDYEQIFTDAGWEYIGSMGGWEYFRKEATSSDMPEIYTDADSKIQKYRRLQWFFVLLLPFVVIAFPSFDFAYASSFQVAVNVFLLVACCGLATFLGLNLLKLEQRIRQIRRLAF
jgi:hypothetical protein